MDERREMSVYTVKRWREEEWVKYKRNELIVREIKKKEMKGIMTVSYTHLTLPTIYSV